MEKRTGPLTATEEAKKTKTTSTDLSWVNKPRLGLVALGHVDSGKSTVLGHLLLKLGYVSEEQFNEVSKIAAELGKNSFRYAFLLSRSKDERQRGITIHCTAETFCTQSWCYTAIDTPGHRDFLRNTLNGISRADVALVVASASMGEFEVSIDKSPGTGHLRTAIQLCRMSGIEQIIVVVNKMDGANYSLKRFEYIQDEIIKLLQENGYDIHAIPIIPISGYSGHNLIQSSTELPWWKGFSVTIQNQNISGVTLLDALEKSVFLPKRSIQAPFRMSISSFRKISKVGNIAIGQVKQGCIIPGTTVCFYPSNARGKVVSIEMHHKNLEQAKAGDHIGVNIPNFITKNKPGVGDVMCIHNVKVDPNPPRLVFSFTALVTVEHCRVRLKAGVHDKKKGLCGGFTPVIYSHSTKVPCQMEEILWRISPLTKQKEENPRFIEDNDQAQIIFRPKKPLVLTCFDQFKPFGRILAFDGTKIVMSGQVISVWTENEIIKIVEFWVRNIFQKDCGWIVEFNRMILDMLSNDNDGKKPKSTKS